ncbi:calcium/sodium antiporter [Parabacteroides sp. PF5-9]|uniref:calcium/sodium antiporter n=1 Tax=Parabacteroides sp. PF5-9 TaxID=1742404 RepID=UPI0024736429|nr:calcium/sodium antiporter [Parabacteroides sp. PF5-9]MDH6357125.1 cation:H+ antiporter [Parabacteroides sp. PF5-9]
MLDILFLLGGLILILVGANILTDGASSVAKRFHISNLVIGLTIVAFGTSAPELAVSLSSALKGSADMAIGNVGGSNIFNVLMIVGCTAAIVPIPITRGTLRKEIPLCLLAAIVLFIFANDILLNGDSQNSISTSDGLVLLCFFLIFLGYTFAIAQSGEESGSQIKEMALWKASLFILGGLAGLVFGGDLFVSGASGIARSLGVSESVIGLTLVAGGTSLPELATSVTAALKKNPEMAIGNVIGSNLFNIFFVLGCSATISPLPIRGITPVDFYVLIGSCILLYMFGLFFKKRTITRPEGLVLVLCYVAYMTYLVLSQ